MLKFAANLSMLYPEVPFIERFFRARQSGFDSVEFLFPYPAGLDAVRQACQDNALSVVLFNLPAGRWGEGERGIAILPDRRQEFRTGVAEAMDYAAGLGVRRMNCLAGKRPDSLPAADAWAVAVENLRYAAKELGRAGLTLLVEPINPYDIPGFFLNTTQQTVELLTAIGEPNVRIQYDIYHMQRTQGEILATFVALKPLIAHLQIADNPGRHQPGTGELHYGRILAALEAAGYDGHIGLEYLPLGTTEESLGWWRQYQVGQFIG